MINERKKLMWGAYMYDGHIYCYEYKDFKDAIANIIHGEDTETDVQELTDKIQKVYDEGRMSGTQYDDLMSYIQDLL